MASAVATPHSKPTPICNFNEKSRVSVVLADPNARPLLSGYKCTKCHEIAWCPVVDQTDHIYCSRCATSAGITDFTTLQTHNPLAYKVLASVAITCVSDTAFDCNWVGPYSDAMAHVKETCGMTVVTCSLCKDTLFRWRFVDHANFTCPELQRKCVYCETRVPPDAMIKHIEKECTSSPDACVNCPIINCPMTVKRKSYAKHMAEMQEHIECISDYLKSKRPKNKLDKKVSCCVL